MKILRILFDLYFIIMWKKFAIQFIYKNTDFQHLIWLQAECIRNKIPHLKWKENN